MGKSEIVNEIAKGKMVEQMVQNIAHQSLSADLKDLCQMVYLILLEYDEQKLQDLWSNNQMNFFLARIIINQFRSSNSPFHMIYRKFRSMVDKEIHVANDKTIEEIDIFLTSRVGHENY
jgi:hypothetical protein